VIAGFCSVVNEIYACFFYFTQNRMMVSYRRFGETYRPHHNQSLIKIKAWSWFNQQKYFSYLILSYIVYDWFEKIYRNYSCRYCPLTLSLRRTLKWTSNPACPISFHITNNRNFCHRLAVQRERFLFSIKDVAICYEYRATLYSVLFKLWLDVWSS
jgi:hypothetical protein